MTARVSRPRFRDRPKNGTAHQPTRAKPKKGLFAPPARRWSCASMPTAAMPPCDPETEDGGGYLSLREPYRTDYRPSFLAPPECGRVKAGPADKSFARNSLPANGLRRVSRRNLRKARRKTIDNGCTHVYTDGIACRGSTGVASDLLCPVSQPRCAECRPLLCERAVNGDRCRNKQ